MLLPESEGMFSAQFSPDGKWIAFDATVSGRSEVYVSPRPTSGNGLSARWQISRAGGQRIRWRGDSRELYYMRQDGMIMAVSVDGSASEFRMKNETALFQAPYFNVYDDGGICQGSASVPEGTTAEKVEAWNDAFFGSFFTHPNVRKNLVKYRGGACKFWQDMLDGRVAQFPERVLVPVQMTLGQLLGGNERRND